MDEHLARVLLAAGGRLTLTEAQRQCGKRVHTHVPLWTLQESINRMVAFDELLVTADQELILLPIAYETWND